MSTVYQNFTPRHRTAHKGDFGHVLIVGGDHGMGGAVRLCAEAALRVGAGLVSVATRAAHIALFATRPEVMCHAVQTADDLTPLIKKATVIVLGSGLGKSDWSHALFQAVLPAKQLKVMDADALNLLAKFPEKQSNWILTPHPGEAGRLLHCTAESVQSNRPSAAKKITEQYGGVVVLKGADTLVQTEHDAPVICEAGNPGMATAGMGDVLSGVLGGLLAQHFSLYEAAKTGVLLHAMAGDVAAREGGERGLLAMDVMPHLRRLVNP